MLTLPKKFFFKENCFILAALTKPVGMPRARLKSSEGSPGFFCLSRVSNSLPCKSRQERERGERGRGRGGEGRERGGEGRRGGREGRDRRERGKEAEAKGKERGRRGGEGRKLPQIHKTPSHTLDSPHSTSRRGWSFLVWSAT